MRDNMEFFKDAKGNIVYNKLCMDCQNQCKQSHKVTIVLCKKYKKGEK